MKQRKYRNRLLLLALGCLVVAVSGISQNAPKTISNFKPGLVTNTNPFSLDYEGFTEFTNWDFQGDGLRVRQGIAAVSDSLEDEFVEAVARILVRGELQTKIDENTPGYFGVPPGWVSYWITINRAVSLGLDGPVEFLGEANVYILEDDTTTAPVDSMRIISSTWYPPVRTLLVVVVDAADTVGFIVGDSIWIRMDTTRLRTSIDAGSITGIYSFFDRLGQKFLLSAVPALTDSASSFDNLWYDIMISEESKYTPIRRIAKRVPRETTPIWATYRNHVFWATRGMRAGKWNGTRAGPLTPRAPGQIEVTPIPGKGVTAGGDSAFFLDGAYRWALRLRFPQHVTDTGTSHQFSYVTPLYQISNGRAVLYDLWGVALDSMEVMNKAFDTTSGFLQLRRSFASQGAMKIQFLRTKGYPEGGRPAQDSLFFLKEFTVNLDTIHRFQFVDSTPDTALKILDGNSDTALGLIPVDSVDVEFHTQVSDETTDTTGLQYHAFSNVIGAPQLIHQMTTHDSIYFGEGFDNADSVMWWDTVGIGAVGGSAQCCDSIYEVLAGSPWVSEILTGKDDHRDSTWVATGYFIVQKDTLSQIAVESDSSANLIVPHKISNAGGADTDIITGIVLGIPEPTVRDSGLIRSLFRYMLYMGFQTDTTFVFRDTIKIDLRTLDGATILRPGQVGHQGEIFIETRGNFAYFGLPSGITKTPLRELRIDGPYHVAEIIDARQTIYVDTFTWNQVRGIDKLARKFVVNFESSVDTTEILFGEIPSGRFWTDPEPVPPLNGIMVYADRLIGWHGSTLIEGAVDTPGIFRPFMGVVFNLDDGDEITWVQAVGPNLHVYKHYSRTILYDAVGGLPTKSAQSFGVGCVAPQTFKHLSGRSIYLSARGVMTEQTEAFKDYQVELGLISEDINDLLLGQRSMTDLKGASAIIWDDKYILSFPNTDTSFVYWFKNGAWGIWLFSFYQGTEYDTLEVVGLTRSLECVIALDTDERVYKLGGSYLPYDIGVSTVLDSGAVSARLRTGPLELRPIISQVYQVGINGFTGTLYDTVVNFALGRLLVDVIDNQDVVLESTQFDYSTKNYKLRLVNSVSSLFPSIRIRTGDSAIDSFTLRSIHVWMNDIGEPVVE